MIKIPITPKILKQAESEADKIGLLHNSIRRGQGNVIGCLGEILVANYCNGLRADKGVCNFEYDMLIGDKTVDVKTKERSVPPLPAYNCTVAAFNRDQKCDYYAFVSVLSDYSAGWILGSISKEEFFKLASFSRKGDADPGSPKGFRFREDCYNLPIWKLGFGIIPVKNIDRVAGYVK